MSNVMHPCYKNEILENISEFEINMLKEYLEKELEKTDNKDDENIKDMINKTKNYFKDKKDYLLN